MTSLVGKWFFPRDLGRDYTTVDRVSTRATSRSQTTAQTVQFRPILRAKIPLFPFVRSLLFQLEPERAHHLGLAALRAAGHLPWPRAPRIDPRLEQKIWGKTFVNPIGLAAGFDKDGRAIRGLAALGFGFLEVGTVTPRPQPGNPKPRMFRHPAAESVQNALGFNNQGAAALARRLAALARHPVPIGINLGKNKDTAAERALDDYQLLFEQLGARGDYLVVNLSSPNTPGLRDLQNEQFVREVLRAAQGTAAADRPILVKLSPDLEPRIAADLASAALDAGAAGIIATNTTTDYSRLPSARPAGGLSGRVLRERSFEVFRAIAERTFGRGVLVSVGGIDSAEEAYRRLRAGATLVQLYTALVFRGPFLPRRIAEGVVELMTRDGAQTLAEVIGADRKRA